MINKDLLQELYGKYDNWNERTEEYNRITSENRTSSALRSNYSRNKVSFNEMTDKIIDEPMHEWGEKDLLALMNLNPNEFQLRDNVGTFNKWWLDSQGNADELAKRIRNGQIKLNIEKVKFELTQEIMEDILNKIDLKPRVIKNRPMTNSKRMLEIPIFDAHFGNMELGDYKVHQEKIATYIRQEDWEQVLFVIGQDLFHNDDFRGRTTGGTLISHEDMQKAYDNAFDFYTPLIDLALENSTKVDIVYSRGNHDETFGWTFVDALMRLYPQVNVCREQAEHKDFRFHHVFLGYTHGDKISDKKVVKNFEALFRLPMAIAKRRIIRKGHIHTLKSFDDNGTTVYTLGTANDSDQWHIDNGFIGNYKAFEIFVHSRFTQQGHFLIDNIEEIYNKEFDKAYKMD